MAGLKNKVVKGTIWAMMERFIVQLMSFVVTLVLARLLTPSDYGTIALLSIFITISSLLVTSGMGMALVQKKNANELDFNSLFYASLAMAAVLYTILFIAAPFIADFYAVKELKPILRTIALTLFFSAANSVQTAELTRKMLFDKRFRISVIVSLSSAVVGISLAFMGFGPWALVWQTVVSGFSGVVAYWFIIAWRPRLIFSFASLKSLFAFGWKVSVVSIIYNLYVNTYALLIGKFYSKEDLAFVNKGRATPNLAMGAISGTICGVSFPALAQMQDNPDRVREAVRKMIQCSSFIVFPLMVGLACCANDVVYLLFGEKWMPCVPYMRLACFTFAMQPFHDINLQAIAALGRADVFLKLELIKDLVGVSLILIFLRYDVFLFMAMLAFISGPVALYVNTWHNKRLIKYPLLAQLRDVFPMLLGCIAMVICILGLMLVFPSKNGYFVAIIRLLSYVLVGGLVFLSVAWLLRISALREYICALRPIVMRLSPSSARYCDVLCKRFNHG